MPEPPEHYYASTPGVASSRRTIELDLPDLRLTLLTDTGVFSFKQLDAGTRVLLENAPRPAVRGDLLDLGCGYGPIALTLAHRQRRRRVWAVDVNERALELVRENAAAAGLSGVRAALPGDVPADVRFAAVYSNPPIRVGKAALHDLLLQWLPRLLPGGAAYLVVQRNLGSDSLARWLSETGFPTRRLLSRHGYRVLEVKPRSSTTTTE
ncbi:methyltransferase domain-containing protein [Jiangella aurantiaca]|uniref:Methyltransferase domain-containing protein n=1 Tax=Jiangella aurantiaca TaxID=2530373 RepID=A0A4R5A625_9ACTN|nr:methyltransferase [Jiangella aurantiaca]TDD66436.1 methyltransferase domain-containing protein [Jiangella aurantiaca]